MNKMQSRNLRRSTTLLFKMGYRYILVEPAGVASYNRLYVKKWAYNKFGEPMKFKLGELQHQNSEWAIGNLGWFKDPITNSNEYCIAFKKKSYRDFAALL